MRDFILSRAQQMVVGVLLLGVILAGGILILKRIKEERQFIKVVSTKTPNSPSPITTPRPSTTTTSVTTAVKPTTSITTAVKPVLKKPLIININKAGKDELIKLPGIGPKLADRILEYRKENGFFTKPEDIMKVPGIKEKKFEKCKDMIRVD